MLGFEYGYSLDVPDGLVIWEAQFGDFVNAGQVIIDQFIASGEEKWRRLSGITMLLPHGFEGSGPEHSSARLERFLQLCAEDNMQVAYPTTPAQIFHLLRRQVLRPWRKPLVIMSPKSLLRHPKAVSSLSELATGTFQRVVPDPDVQDAKRILLCSGKVYYDLLAERGDARDTALVRLEQLYPLSERELKAAARALPDRCAGCLDTRRTGKHGCLVVHARQFRRPLVRTCVFGCLPPRFDKSGDGLEQRPQTRAARPHVRGV